MSFLQKQKEKIKNNTRKCLKDFLEHENEDKYIISSGRSIDTEQSAEGLKHSKNYSKLLDIYVKSTKQNIRMKSFYKFVFFIITMGLLVGVTYYFKETLEYAFNFFSSIEEIEKISIEAILSVVTVLIPAIVSLVVAFMEIPKIIAQYLFNVEEDNFMDSVIKNIQDYDKAMYELEHRAEEMIASQKENEKELEDEKLEKAPNKGVS